MPETLFAKEPAMTVTALAPWFGSNRMLAPEVGKALRDCEWVGIPFAGGMAEVPHIKARTLVVNDKHKHVISLADIAADAVYGPKLYRRLRRVIFNPWTLEVAQRACATYDPPYPMGGDMEARLNFAEMYFIACWMGRSAKAGTDGEFEGGLPVRWNAGGGDSAVRFHNAVLSLRAWRKTLRRCNFTTLDFREFLKKCKDLPRHGIYCDPPFPGPGDDYRHKFTLQDHRDLATVLSSYRKARVVSRFYDHPLIRELYPESRWHWNHLDGGRKQSNDKAPEVLIVSGGAA